MNEFPVNDEDIKALRLKLLRALAAAPYPKEAIAPLAVAHKLTVPDVKSLVDAYGFPSRADMARHVIELSGDDPLSPPKAQQVAAPPPGSEVFEQPQPKDVAADLRVETLLNAARKSDKARTRRLGEKIHGLIAELRGLVNSESAEREAAAKAEAEKTKLRDEVKQLEEQLAAKKALLTGKPKPKPEAAQSDCASPKELRAWAAKNGIDCPAFGRVPASVVEAYAEAHSD